MSLLPTTEPPEDDSEDLTDEEVERSTPTRDESEFTRLVAKELTPGQASIGKSDARYALHRQELRRRHPHLYCRVSFCCPGEPDKVLVYQIDWLQRGQEYERK